MKKFLFCLILNICVISVATATTKCAKMPTSCHQRIPTIQNSQVTWVWQCNTGNIQGINTCASSTATNAGYATTHIYLSSDVSKNLNCWCKMTTPYLSYWIFSEAFSTAGDCASRCSFSCALHYSDANFRNAAFSNIGDF